MSTPTPDAWHQTSSEMRRTVPIRRTTGFSCLLCLEVPVTTSLPHHGYRVRVVQRCKLQQAGFGATRKASLMEGCGPASGGSSGAGGGGRSAVSSGTAAAGRRWPARGNGAEVEGVVVTYGRYLPIPAAARPWFLHPDSDGDKVPVTVYGRRPDGPVRQHNATLHVRQQGQWRLSGLVSLLKDLDVHKGDMVRLTQEKVAGAGGGAAAGTVIVVVVEKVAGQQEGQHRRRHVRTTLHAGTPETVALLVWWWRWLLADTVGRGGGRGISERMSARQVHIGRPQPITGFVLLSCLIKPLRQKYW